MAPVSQRGETWRWRDVDRVVQLEMTELETEPGPCLCLRHCAFPPQDVGARGVRRGSDQNWGHPGWCITGQEGSKGMWVDVYEWWALQMWKENTAFPLGGLLPTGTVVTLASPQGCHSSLMTASCLCSNRRPAFGGRDVSTERRSCGGAPSYPSCETGQREGSEHLENR